MKKILSIALIVLCLSILCSCGGSVLDINAYTWELKNASVTNTDLSKTDEISFDGVAILSAKSGVLTIRNSATGEIYEGTYFETSSNSKGRDYSFNVGSFSGYGVLSNTDYYDEAYIPTLVVSLSNGNTRYNLRFSAQGE